MIAKYAGPCFLCGVRIEPGESCDYERGKGIRHVECQANAQTETPEELAERLGYR